MKTRKQMQPSMALATALALALAAGGARTPERNPNRSSSFQWTSDVRERLRILEEHAADAARERIEAELKRNSRGWSTPQSPAAGDGSVR